MYRVVQKVATTFLSLHQVGLLTDFQNSFRVTLSSKFAMRKHPEGAIIHQGVQNFIVCTKPFESGGRLLYAKIASSYPTQSHKSPWLGVTPFEFRDEPDISEEHVRALGW